MAGLEDVVDAINNIERPTTTLEVEFDGLISHLTDVGDILDTEKAEMDTILRKWELSEDNRWITFFIQRSSIDQEITVRSSSILSWRKQVIKRCRNITKDEVFESHVPGSLHWCGTEHAGHHPFETYAIWIRFQQSNNCLCFQLSPEVTIKKLEADLRRAT